MSQFACGCGWPMSVIVHSATKVLLSRDQSTARFPLLSYLDRSTDGIACRFTDPLEAGLWRRRLMPS
jgi:hypothetical protein